MTILEQWLSIQDKQIISLPGNKVEPIAVKEQNGRLVMYYTTDLDIHSISHEGPLQDMTILIAGTGHTRSDIEKADYIGTVAMSNGLVWHCYKGNSGMQEA